jgi:hypothetical protein
MIEDSTRIRSKAIRRLGLVPALGIALVMCVLAAGITLVATRSTSGGADVRPTLASAAATTACNSQLTRFAGMSAPSQATQLTGAYSSTAGLVTTWDENRPNQIGPNSEFSSWPSDEAVSVCYFSGDFTGFPGPPTAPSSYHTIVVVVQPNGSSTLDFAAPANLTFGPPPSSSK